MSASLRKIDRQFNRLEADTQSLLALVATMPSSAYLQKPTTQAWSVGQIVHHVYLSEFLSLAYLRKKLAYPDQVPRYHPRSWFGTVLIKFVFATGIKVKAPPSIDMHTKPDVLPLSKLIEKWKTLRQETNVFITSNYDQFGSHLAFRHLFAGRMTMYQMLIFFGDHLRHHHRQVKRVYKEIEKTR